MSHKNIGIEDSSDMPGKEAFNRAPSGLLSLVILSLCFPSCLYFFTSLVYVGEDDFSLHETGGTGSY
jgi:hypothetical protein